MVEVIKAKLVIVGDGAVGKTTYLLGCMSPEKVRDYIKNYIPTVLDTYHVEVPVANKCTLNLEVWDTAGQESFQQLRQLSFGGVDFYFVCYSVNNPVTLDNVKNVWLHETKLSSQKNHAQFAIIGTKNDLELKTNKVFAEKLIKKFKGEFHITVSAFTGKNLKNSFKQALLAIYLSRTKNKSKCCRLF